MRHRGDRYHGLSVGVGYRRFGLVAVVFLCDELSANVDADFVNGLIIGAQAARLLGITEKTLLIKRKKYGMK